MASSGCCGLPESLAGAEVNDEHFFPEGAITVTLCFDPDFNFFLPAGRLRLLGFDTRWFTWARMSANV